MTFSTDIQPGGKVHPGQLILDPERPDEPICDRALPFTEPDKSSETTDVGPKFTTATETEG